MHPKIHQRAACSEGYEEIKQKTDRRHKSINCFMLVFSCRLRLWVCVCMVTHVLSAFKLYLSRNNSLGLIECITNSCWCFQSAFFTQIWQFPSSTTSPEFATSRLHARGDGAAARQTPSNVHSRWSLCCAGSRAVMQPFRGSTRIWRTKCIER